jgi:hypothetical protein
MHQRKQRCLRIEDLSKYLPRSLLPKALKELVHYGFLVDSPPLRELMEALTVKELTSVVKQQKGLKGLGGRKEEIIDGVWLFVGSQRTVHGTKESQLARMLVTRILKEFGPFYRVNPAVAEGFHVMVDAYIRPSNSTFEDICLKYFHKTAYASYDPSPTMLTSLFPSRDEFLAYNECVSDAIVLEESWGQWDLDARTCFTDRVLGRAQLSLFASSSSDHVVERKPRWFARYTASWANMDLLLKLSEYLRLSGMTEQEYNCLHLFFMQKQHRKEKRAVYLIRKAHLELMSYSRRTEAKDHSLLTRALESCLEAMCDPSLTDFLKIDLCKKALKVAKAHQIARLEFPKEMIFLLREQLDLKEANYVEIRGHRATVDSDKPTKTFWHDPVSHELISVESVALNHYQLQGYCGFHSESSIVTTIVSYFAQTVCCLVFVNLSFHYCFSTSYLPTCLTFSLPVIIHSPQTFSMHFTTTERTLSTHE